MAGGEFGMVEIVCWVVMHSDSFHDGAGAEVGGDGEGDDLWKAEDVETVAKRGEGAFGGVPAAPVFMSDAPADFDCGSKVSLERYVVEADESDELGDFGNRNGPWSPFLPLEDFCEFLCEAIALGTVEELGEVLHDAGVGVEAGKGLKIGFSPRAEDEAGCF